MSDPRCRSADKCVGKTSDGPASTVKRDTICSACVVDIQRLRDELPHLALALRVFKGGSVKIAYTSKVNRTPAPQAPLSVWVTDLIDEIWDVIERTAAAPIRDLILRPAEKFIIWQKGRPREAYLDGVDRALDLRKCHHRASSAVGLHPRWERRAARCPSCDQLTLGTFVGSDVISCTDEECLVQMDLDDYDRYLWILDRESK